MLCIGVESTNTVKAKNYVIQVIKSTQNYKVQCK